MIPGKDFSKTLEGSQERLRKQAPGVRVRVRVGLVKR